MNKQPDKVSAEDDLEKWLPGRSQAMVELRERVRFIANTPANVLIVGEPGTGKETVAHAIHDLSSYRNYPFITVYCSALPEHMAEAELFGYEAGAFPGAVRPRFGKMEQARNGTLFLDSVHAMSPETQAKLVQSVEDNRITRLGGNDPIDLNSRYIGASVINPVDFPDAQATSMDILHRLNVVTLHVPSLCDRIDDLPEQFIQMATQAAARIQQPPPPPPSDSLLSRLLSRRWTGNMRELRNAAERYAFGFDVLDEPDVPEQNGALADRVAAFERQVISAELKAHNGHLKPVYKALGISRKTLYEKMQKHGLDRSDFRD